MAIILILILIPAIFIIAKSVKNRGILDWKNGYLSFSTCGSVKGFFVILIFLSHFNSYATYESSLDQPLKAFCFFFGQLIVVPFLFYSGYGILESIKRKGTSYIHSFPKNRILKVLFHFDLALLLFIAMNYYLGISYDNFHTLLSFIAWESIGNSNWFIFAILLTYTFTYISFSIKMRTIHSILIISLLTMAYIVVLYLCRKNEPWWYNTVICFPLGMYFSYYRAQLETNVLSNRKNLILAIVLVSISFIAISIYPQIFHSVTSQIRSILFAMALILWSRLFPSGNKLLNWFGDHVFEIYILQRIPMALLKETPLYSNIYIYFICCFTLTLALAVLFKKTTNQLDIRLFQNHFQKAPVKS